MKKMRKLFLLFMVLVQIAYQSTTPHMIMAIATDNPVSDVVIRGTKHSAAAPYFQTLEALPQLKNSESAKVDVTTVSESEPRTYSDSSTEEHTHTYENGICTVCGVADYDDVIHEEDTLTLVRYK